MNFDRKIMNSKRFQSLSTAQGPFVSVYVDDTHDTPDAEEQVAARWGDIRGHLEDNAVDERVIATLEEALLHSKPAVGRQGRGIIATRDGVLLDEHLASPPPATVVRVSDYPYILPLVELGKSRPTYVFAAVDHLGADITMHNGDRVRSETVEGSGYPVHKPASAGWNGYGDLQHKTEEAVRTNVRAVADRITELVDETGAEIVFVVGEVRSRANVVSALPDRVAARVSQLRAGARGSRVTENDDRDPIDAEVEKRRRAAIEEVVTRFEAQSGRRSGLAVEGLAAVCAALREGAVETLIVGDLEDATVVAGERRTTIAPDSDALSELGAAPLAVVRADEALPFAAIAVGASLVRVRGGIAPADGIGALLRYAPSDMSQVG